MAYEAIFRTENKSVKYTPSGADVDAGDVIVQGELIGVAATDIADGVQGDLYVEGVFDFAKTAGVGEAITAGAKVYWDNTGKVATETVGANKLIGKTVLAATDDDTTVRVKLNQ